MTKFKLEGPAHNSAIKMCVNQSASSIDHPLPKVEDSESDQYMCQKKYVTLFIRGFLCSLPMGFSSSVGLGEIEGKTTLKNVRSLLPILD